jgi:hypothetical protein
MINMMQSTFGIIYDYLDLKSRRSLMQEWLVMTIGLVFLSSAIARLVAPPSIPSRYLVAGSISLD